MNAEEYAQLGKDIQAAIVEIIRVAAPMAKVLDRDPVNLNDESAWLAALRSDEDVVDTRQMIHAWLVTFQSPDDPKSEVIRSIEPTFEYRVQVFHYHDFGTDATNSEKLVRDEILKVQWAFAGSPKLSGLTGVKGHTQLRQRVSLKRLGGEIVHRGDGSLRVDLKPQVVY